MFGVSKDLRQRLAGHKAYQAVVLLCLAVLLCSLLGILSLLYRPLPLPPGDHEARIFEVHPRESLRQIADRMHQEGIITHPLLMAWYGRFTGESRAIHTGEYAVTRQDTLAGLLHRMAEGDTYQRTWTILPGWHLRQIRASLAQNPYLKHDSQRLSNHALAKRLHIDHATPEGYFMPESYFFSKGDADLTLLTHASEKMHQALQAQWPHRALQLDKQSAYHILIVASLIEKETACETEKPLIAGVIYARLKAGMKLQIDPTVIYGMGKDYTGRLSRRDLKYKSRYNTYLHRGLPPTPIAAPGKTSLQAALHPQKSNHLYYLAKGDGCHVFSEHLKAHRKAYRRYIKGKT